eukprot:scaffold21065_cov57-Attheya_sp.AAC.1
MATASRSSRSSNSVVGVQMGSGDFGLVMEATKTQPVIVPHEEDQRAEFANHEHENWLLQQLEENSLPQQLEEADNEHCEGHGRSDEDCQTDENVEDGSVAGDEWDQFRPLFSSVVQVTIATQRSVPVSFQLPASLVVMREREMQRHCQELGIGSEFWKGSRLGRALRHHWTEQHTQRSGGLYGMCQLDHACNIGNDKSTQNTISFTFDPEERDVDDSVDSSNSIFTWNPVLVECVESFYESGRIRVPDESLGHDVLLVLEFFGIVYSPQQLVFDSFGCFLRVKLWTDYYSHRATVADWIVHQLITSHSRLSHAFCTCPEALDPKSCLYVGTKRCDPLDGGLFLDNSRSDSDPETQSCSVVHEFFNDDEGLDGINSEEDSMAALLRQDFCTYLQNSLPGTVVTFSLREVTVIADSSVKRQETWNIVRRAFLHIDFGGQAAKHAIAEPTTVVLGKRKDAKDGGTLISALEDEVELSTFQVGLDESKDLVHTMDMLEKSNSPLDYSMESSCLSKLDKEPFDLDSTLDGVTSSFQDKTAAVVTPAKNADKDDTDNADMVVPMTLSEMGHFSFESSSNSPKRSKNGEVYETIERADPRSTPGNIEVCHMHARSDTGSICTKEDRKNATDYLLSTTNTTASTESSHSLEGAKQEQSLRSSTPTPLKRDVSILDIEYFIPDKEEEARLLSSSIKNHEQHKNTLEGENAAWLRGIFIGMLDCWGDAKSDSYTMEERESVCNAIDRAETMASQEEGDDTISGCSSIDRTEESQEKFDETIDDNDISTVGSAYGIEVKHKLPNSFPSMSFAQGLSSVPDISPHKRSDLDNTSNPYGLTNTYSL